MRGAVAAGHPLTAQAGARVLAEGGNAVDACVAAAFASWVAESPLTGPGAGGFALVAAGRRPAGAARRLLRLDARASGCRSRRGAQMHAIDVGFGGDSETTQVFRIGAASCAVPGTALGLEAVHQAYGRLPWPELLQPAIELARDGIELTRPQAHLHAILDLILRHTAEGQRALQPSRRRRACCPADTLRLPDLAGTLERIAERRRERALPRRARARDRRHGARGRRLADARATSRQYRVVWRRPVRVRVPRRTSSSRTRRRRRAGS